MKNDPFSVIEKYRKPAGARPQPTPEPSPFSDHDIVASFWEHGEIVAVVLKAPAMPGPLWLLFDPKFEPQDKYPIFYADEIALLKDKPVETLRKVYESKQTFGPGTRVRQ